MASILVVDDERSMRDFLSVMLKRQEYDVETVGTANEAVEIIEKKHFDLIITDVMMPGMTGIELLEFAKKKNPNTAIIVITAYASHNTAVEAMKLGAEDYITKPFNVDEFSIIVRRCLQRIQLAQENVELRKELKREHRFENIVGKSRAMIELFRTIERISATPTTVLITAESGTGKELVAKAIHFNSPRSRKRFVSINCGALPDTLLESELFGYEKGAFTGADRQKTGLFESASGGTLFLDEIGTMPYSMQIKLLRAMQERRIRRVGGTEEIPVDVRIIAATNVDLETLVSGGQFRKDLYYRVNVIKLNIPTLRERREDIMLLGLHFLDKYADMAQRPIRGFTDSARKAMEAYDWPGNVRELENAIERAVALETHEVISVDSLPDNIINANRESSRIEFGIPEEGMDLEGFLEELRRKYVLEAMRLADGKQIKAAELLKMTPRSLRYLLDKYELR